MTVRLFSIFFESLHFLLYVLGDKLIMKGKIIEKFYVFSEFKAFQMIKVMFYSNFIDF